MEKLDDRTMANFDVVLEEACRGLPHGGDHLLRKEIAEKILASAQKGSTTLAALTTVAKAAVLDACNRKRAHE